MQRLPPALEAAQQLLASHPWLTAASAAAAAATMRPWLGTPTTAAAAVTAAARASFITPAAAAVAAVNRPGRGSPAAAAAAAGAAAACCPTPPPPAAGGGGSIRLLPALPPAAAAAAAQAGWAAGRGAAGTAAAARGGRGIGLLATLATSTAAGAGYSPLFSPSGALRMYRRPAQAWSKALTQEVVKLTDWRDLAQLLQQLTSGQQAAGDTSSRQGGMARDVGWRHNEAATSAAAAAAAAAAAGGGGGLTQPAAAAARVKGRPAAGVGGRLTPTNLVTLLEQLVRLAPPAATALGSDRAAIAGCVDQVLTMLTPRLTHADPRVLANTCYCLAQLRQVDRHGVDRQAFLTQLVAAAGPVLPTFDGISLGLYCWGLAQLQYSVDGAHWQALTGQLERLLAGQQLQPRSALQVCLSASKLGLHIPGSTLDLLVQQLTSSTTSHVSSSRETTYSSRGHSVQSSTDGAVVGPRELSLLVYCLGRQQHAVQAGPLQALLTRFDQVVDRASSQCLAHYLWGCSWLVPQSAAQPAPSAPLSSSTAASGAAAAGGGGREGDAATAAAAAGGAGKAGNSNTSAPSPHQQLSAAAVLTPAVLQACTAQLPAASMVDLVQMTTALADLLQPVTPRHQRHPLRVTNDTSEAPAMYSSSSSSRVDSSSSRQGTRSSSGSSVGGEESAHPAQHSSWPTAEAVSAAASPPARSPTAAAGRIMQPGAAAAVVADEGASTYRQQQQQQQQQQQHRRPLQQQGTQSHTATGVPAIEAVAAAAAPASSRRATWQSAFQGFDQGVDQLAAGLTVSPGGGAAVGSTGGATAAAAAAGVGVEGVPRGATCEGGSVGTASAVPGVDSLSPGNKQLKHQQQQQQQEVGLHHQQQQQQQQQVGLHQQQQQQVEVPPSAEATLLHQQQQQQQHQQQHQQQQQQVEVPLGVDAALSHQQPRRQRQHQQQQQHKVYDLVVPPAMDAALLHAVLSQLCGRVGGVARMVPGRHRAQLARAVGRLGWGPLPGLQRQG